MRFSGLFGLGLDVILLALKFGQNYGGDIIYIRDTLDEYRKDVPPGWQPGDPKYPVKSFLERVKMWYHLYDAPDVAVGPLLAVDVFED